MPPDDDDLTLDDLGIDADDVQASLEDLLKDPESDLLPQVKPILQKAYLDAMAHVQLAKDDVERKPHEDQANAIEAVLSDEAIWEYGGVIDLPENAVAPVREAKPDLGDEIDRRRQVAQERRDREDAQRVERERIDALSKEERAAALVASEEAARFDQQRLDFDSWMSGLVENGELVQALHHGIAGDVTDRVVLVPPGGRTPPSLQPVVDLFYEWYGLPAHERERWYAERTQAQKDQLSVLYQVRPPVDVDEIPALQESE